MCVQERACAWLLAERLEEARGRQDAEQQLARAAPDAQDVLEVAVARSRHCSLLVCQRCPCQSPPVAAAKADQLQPAVVRQLVQRLLDAHLLPAA